MSTRPRPPKSRTRWQVLLLIVAVSFVGYVLRTNLSIVAPALVGKLGIDEVSLGLVFSAFALGYGLFQFPGGVFGDRYGPRLAVTLLLVSTGVLTLVTGLLPGTSVIPAPALVAALIATRFLLGVSQAPMFPVMTGAMVSSWFPRSQWAFPNGLSSTGLTLGGAATGPLVVWLMAGLGWRGSFLICAPIAFLLAFAWWKNTRDHPSAHPQVSAAELALIDSDRPPAVEATAEAGSWRAVLKDRDLLLLTLSYFCMNYVFYLFFNWFFYYLVEVRGFAEERAALLTTAQWILGSIGAALGGYGCDASMRRLGARRGARVVPVVGLSATALLIAVGTGSASPGLAVASLAIAFGFLQSTDPPYWAATIAIAERHAGSATGVLNTGGNLVGFAGALIVPIIARSMGWPTAIASGAIAALLAVALWFGVRTGPR